MVHGGQSLTDRGVNKEIAIYSRQYGKTDYDELNRVQQEFISMIDIENGRPLLMIKCNISYETVIGYTAALKARIPVIMCDESGAGNVMRLYRPHYIWQRALAAEPYGYAEIGKIADYILYGSIERVRYPVNENLALLLPTSGSIGSSRFVRISYDNIKYNTESIVKALRIDNTGRAGLLLPLNYTYGLSIVNTYLYARGSLIIGGGSAMQRDLWEYFIRCGGNAVCGVPDTYEMLRMMKILEREDLNIKLATQAGGPLRTGTEKYMLELAYRRGFNWAVMYGQTEATARMTCHFLNENPEHIGSVGRVIPGGSITIDDGEIVYRGPNVSMGYADGYKDLASGDNNHGILHTGDLGRMDENGFLYITGRMKRFAKVSGNRVNLDDLEKIVEHYCKIRSACVENEGRIVVVIDKSSDLKTTGIKNSISEVTGINKRLIDVRAVNRIPVNSNGKTDYRKCSEL